MLFAELLLWPIFIVGLQSVYLHHWMSTLKALFNCFPLYVGSSSSLTHAYLAHLPVPSLVTQRPRLWPGLSLSSCWWTLLLRSTHEHIYTCYLYLEGLRDSASEWEQERNWIQWMLIHTYYCAKSEGGVICVHTVIILLYSPVHMSTRTHIP